MTPPRACRDLAGTLISHAAGLTGDSTAAELIAAHHTWLARTDFTASHLHAGTRHDGHRYAWIDWQSAVTALDTRQLSCTATEAAILRIAASLARPVQQERGRILSREAAHACPPGSDAAAAGADIGEP